MPASEVLRPSFKAGEGNQLVAFQKVLCLAISSAIHIAAPTLYHCDRSWTPGDCDGNNTVPIENLLRLSERSHAAISNLPATRIVPEAYYITDKCGGKGALGLPDVVDFSDGVRAYGEMLRRQCRVPCVVIQQRAGRDWDWHKRLKTGGSISDATATRAAFEHRRLSCLLLAPEHVNVSVPCRRVRHGRGVDPIVRFFAEMYVAAHANVFVYNPQSTMHWIVRRLAEPSLKLAPLKERSVPAGLRRRLIG